MAIRIIKTDDPAGDPAVAALREILRGGALAAAGQAGDLDVGKIVAQILDQVKTGGDRAVADLTSRLDRADITPADLRVPKELIEQARDAVEPAFLEVIRAAAANIRRYQEGILVKDPPPVKRGGREFGLRYTPVRRVGAYVPGGRALYPSTVLMTVIPAQVAGVSEIAMASPPTGGEISPIALALAAELGIDEVYRIGGAQAVAALAFGTETIRPVDKIAGPGNAFVAEAKRQVLGHVGIDTIAGPSEVFIIADDTPPAEWVAADLIAQAEHNPGSAVLATTSQELAEKVAGAIDRQLEGLSRREAASEMLDNYSAIIVLPDLDAACELANDFASEHLQIMTADDDAVLAKIRNAGAVFMGIHSPVPLGDYFAGPSHVLPTGGTARFFGPLSCNDFLKATSTVRYDAASFAEDADSVIDFANREGLTGHARAIEIRKESK